MYKRILVPLDGSKRAEAILPHVEELASRYEAAVIFLQIVEPGMAYTSPYDVYLELNLDKAERRVEEVKGYLTDWVEEFQAKGIEAERRVDHGQVVHTILEVAAEEDVDLIAMASHGRTGLARVFYGSVAVGVLHRLDRPLLLVRSHN